MSFFFCHHSMGRKGLCQDVMIFFSSSCNVFMNTLHPPISLLPSPGDTCSGILGFESLVTREWHYLKELGNVAFLV